MSMIDYHC